MALFTTTTKPAGNLPGGLPPVVQQAFAKVTDLGSLPEVTARIVEVVEDPRATARTVHDVVHCDPALATKILKVVNSAFYGLPSQVASLERAILMLGLNSVKNLALAASVSSLIQDAQITPEFHARDVWRHSVAVGVSARLLAGASKAVPADEAFVAGLTHDIGLIVMQQVLPAKLREVALRCQAAPQNYCAAEIELIGADHQAFGGALAAKWKFPPALRHAINYHHEPSSLQPDFQRLAAVVYLADLLSAVARHGYWLTAQTNERSEWMMNLLGLSCEALDRVGESLPDHLAEAEQVFGAT